MDDNRQLLVYFRKALIDERIDISLQLFKLHGASGDHVTFLEKKSSAYASPTQVAAGMKITIVVEIAAMAVGVIATNGLGKVHHDLEITTETDVLVLPISANILSCL